MNVANIPFHRRWYMVSTASLQIFEIRSSYSFF
jgi:hypothetical protein